jgi:CHAD domain-containing protein
LKRPGRLWLASIAVGGVGAIGAVAAAAARRRNSSGSAAESVPEPAHTPPPSRRARPHRAYRLGRGEPAGEGLRRIALGRLDHARDQLDVPGHDPDGVHEARKDLKKLRAVLRLLRKRLGDDVYRRENSGARDTARMLAGARDAQVRLDTLDDLVAGGSVPGSMVTGFRARLEAELGARNAEHDAGPEPMERIEATRARAAEWRVGGEGWDAVGPGIKRSYRRGRARMSDALARPSVENLHEWRKRVKDLWYHLRVIAPAWPPVIDALAEEAHVLSERLGDDHDLAVLGESARFHHDAFADPADLDALLDAITDRRGRLQSEAVAIGRRLYADDPAAFAARTQAWWSAWRSMDGEQGSR